MSKQVQEVTTNVSETGEIELVRKDWTPLEESPSNAYVLRATAYSQAMDLEYAFNKTVCKTIEELLNERANLSDHDLAWLNEVFVTVNKAREVLQNVEGTLWEWIEEGILEEQQLRAGHDLLDEDELDD